MSAARGDQNWSTRLNFEATVPLALKFVTSESKLSKRAPAMNLSHDRIWTSSTT